MSPALLKTILTTLGGILCVCGPIVRPYNALIGDLMPPIGGVLLGGAHLRRPGDRKVAKRRPIDEATSTQG